MLWIQRYSPVSIGVLLFGIGGLLGYIYLMIHGTGIVRIIASAFAFIGMMIVGLLLGMSATEKEYIHNNDHEIMVETERFLFAESKTYYQRVNWLFATEIARCDGDEDIHCSQDIQSNHLVITKCAGDGCISYEILLE